MISIRLRALSLRVQLQAAAARLACEIFDHVPGVADGAVWHCTRCRRWLVDREALQHEINAKVEAMFDQAVLAYAHGFSHDRYRRPLCFPLTFVPDGQCDVCGCWPRYPRAGVYRCSHRVAMCSPCRERRVPAANEDSGVGHA